MFAGSLGNAEKVTTNVRRLAVEHGRLPEDIRCFAGAVVRRRQHGGRGPPPKAEADAYTSAEGLAAHMLGGMGIDLGDAPLDTPLADLHVEGGRGVLQAIIDSVPGGRPTIEDMIPGSYTEVIEGLLPELRRRGMAQSEYPPGTFREKLFSDVPGRPADGRLDERHPAAAYRGAFRQSANPE